MSILLLENYIKCILSEKKEFIKKLHVYDFDATLYDSGRKEWIESAVNSAKISIEDLNTYTVLCTARTNKPDIVKETSDLLKEKGLYFANKFFMPENFSGSTPKYKSEVVENILNKIISVEKVVFWEDREDNLLAVNKLITKSFPAIYYDAIHVKNGNPTHSSEYSI